MANTNKIKLETFVDRRTLHKIEGEAAKRGMTRSAFIRFVLTQSVEKPKPEPAPVPAPPAEDEEASASE